MTGNNASQSAMIVSGVGNHLDSKYNRMWAYEVITPTDNYYLLGGEKLSPDEMDIKYPVVDLIKNGSEKGEGKDGRTNWMQ